MKNTRRKQAVSEIVGTFLLLAIVVSTFSVVSLSIYSMPPPSSTSTAKIVGIAEGRCFILEHRGGEPLGLDTKVYLTICNQQVQTTAGELLDEKDKADGVWNIGERLVYYFGSDPSQDPNPNYQNANVKVVDMETNSIIMDADLIIHKAPNLSPPAPFSPQLSYLPTSISFGTQPQGWTGVDTLQIWNSGNGTLNYTISESTSWISISLTSGNSTGEHHTITVNVDTGSMSEGYYNGDIQISSDNGSGTIPVEINIESLTPPQPPAPSRWAKTYGGYRESNGGNRGIELFEAFQQVSDGYIAGGITNTYGIYSPSGNFLLVKTNFTGNITWAKTYGTWSGAGNNILKSVQQTSDGGYLLGGWTAYYSPFMDFLVIKTNPNGDVTWAKAYENGDVNYLAVVQQTSDGYILGGYTHSFGGGVSDGDFLVIKTNLAGDVIWAKIYGVTGAYKGEYLTCLQQTSDGYILGGYTTSWSSIGTTDILLIKINTNGDIIWAKTYGDYAGEYPNFIQQTSDNGFLFGGSSNSYVNLFSDDALLIKTDSNGDVTWARTYGKTNSNYGQSSHNADYFKSGVQTSDGYVIGGSTNSFGTVGYPDDYDYLMIKTDNSGALTWAKTYGGHDYVQDEKLNFINKISGGYIFGGYTYCFGSVSKDAFLIQTDENGNLNCNSITNDVSTILPNQNVQITGQDRTNDPLLQTKSNGANFNLTINDALSWLTTYTLNGSNGNTLTTTTVCSVN